MSTFAEYTKKKKKKDVDVSELAKKHSSFRDYTSEVLGVEIAPIGSPVKSTVDIAPVKPTVNVSSAKPADKITSLMSVYGNKDFSTKSGYVSTKSEGIWEKLGSKYGMNYNDLQYEYINNQNDIRKEIDSKAMSWGSDTGKTSSSYKEKALDYMTDDEVAVYNYYYQTEGKDKAQEFLDALAETLNARKAGKDFESIEGKTAREILYGTVAGAEQFKQGVKGFGSMITGKDDYIPQTSTQILTGKIREDLADDGTKVFGNSLGQVVHDALSIGTNMLPSVMTGGVAGTILMGATAAGNAYQQDLNEFGDKEKARIYATTIGALEGTLQYMLGGIGKLGGTSAAISNAVSGVKNAALRFALEYGGKIGSEALEEGLQEVLDPLVKNKVHGTEENVDWENVAYSALLGGLMGGVFGATEVSSTHLNANENAVVDKVYKDTIAEKEADGKKLSESEKRKIYDETIKKLEKGYIDIDTIENVIGGDTYNSYKAEVDKEAMQEADYKRQLEALKDQANTLGNAKKYQEIEAKLSELKNNSKTTEIKKQLSEEVSKIVQGTKLAESYNERSRRGQNLEVDVESYKNESAKQTAQNFKDFGVNNTNASHDYLDLVTKVAEDRGHTFKFMTTKQLEESIANGNPYNITEDAGKVEAFVSGSTKEIVINMDANKSLSSLVGHEITHTMEGDKTSYGSLQNALFDLAKTRDEYDSRWESIQRRYSNLTEEQQMQELTSDLVGDYVFGDTDFISNLSTENPNIFKKIYNEIKYLWKMATAGSKEARELERVKREFEKIWRDAKVGSASEGNVRLSLANKNITKDTTIQYVINDSYRDVAINDYKSLEMLQNDVKKIARGTYENKATGYKADINSTTIQKILKPTKAFNPWDVNHNYVENLNASLHLAELFENAVYIDSKPPQKAKNEGKQIKEYHYFVSPIEMNNSDYRVLITAREKVNSNTLYVVNAEILPNNKKDASVVGQKPTNMIDASRTISVSDLVNGVKIYDYTSKQNDVYTDADIRYSLSEDGTEIKTDRASEVQYSLRYDAQYMDNAIANNNSKLLVDKKIMEDTKTIRAKIAARMEEIKDKGLVGLPEDIEGNTFISNSSYGGTEENTTICPRSLSAEAFVDAVSEMMGRPLTVEEQIYISQDLQGRSLTPECTYCYVATDRKAYRAFLGEYISQRDSVIEKVKNNPDADVSRNGELYQEFLNGRKDTNPMYKRFKMWVDAYKNGKPMVDANHLANMGKLMGDINSEFGAELKPQITDAMKYAQSASWAKKRVNYVAYNGHILKWKQDRINKLNSHYGLRMYSFSDFHPAFTLENMQMITDASVRGLKMLGYTKDTDFVEIFAPSGMNINISTFGFVKDGVIAENNLIGAEWERAKELREQYPNVGITFVATDDTLVNWALDQDWIDVVIPFHLVRTGKEVAKAFKYHDYTNESSDTKTSEWTKGDEKYIAPTEHNNDKTTYLSALEKNHLKPRFERFVNHPNYMKLVNECRLPASECKPVQPIFNEDASMKALAKLEVNGYYQPVGGSVDRMYEIAAEVADKMQSELAPAQNRIADDSYTSKEYGNHIYSKDVALEGVAEIAPTTSTVEEMPIRSDYAPPQEYAEAEPEYLAIRPEQPKGEPRMARVKPSEMDAAPVKEDAPVAQILTEEPTPEKKKSRFWEQAAELVADKGFVFENLSKKTKNRELEAKWNFIRYADSKAQDFIGNGADGVKSLDSIQKEVTQAGITKELYEYLYHLHNIDRMSLSEKYDDTENKPVFGDSVTADVSRSAVAELEARHPELKRYANEIYSVNNYLRNLLVEGGVISQETSDLWAEMYPHYVPIRRAGEHGLDINVPLDTGRTGVNAPVKRATGGSSDILPLFDTMAQRALQTYKAVAKNRLGVELKNTLGTTIGTEAADVDSVIEGVDQNEELLQKGKNGRRPTFTVFEGGEKVTFEITDTMYDALKPTSEALTYTNKIANTISNAHRGVLTEYNPSFLARNFIKDTQDVLINSQHPAKTYANFPKAMKEMTTKGKWYTEYVKNGGEQNTYFDKKTNTYSKEEKSKFIKAVGMPLNAISTANNFIEKLPRLAEYIASREAGRSIEVSMLDSARVTTNFAAGGDLTKFLNRNGATFLNASVQGVMQQVRNVREAKMNGLKGWAQLAGKCAVASIPAIILNNLMWDDDDEYEELSDYVKQNYYVVAKFGDGKFVRIPKGRTLAVIQDALEQTMNALSGNDEADLASFTQLVITNLAPNNPIEDNILAPVIQAWNNETWYGDDLVPTRLQDLPSEEQYDESTDSLSVWIGERVPISPYKINYLLNQYSGAVGDSLLPMITPEAESEKDTAIGKITAPIRDAFTTDSVLKNQNVSDFYDKKDELVTNAKRRGATDEDILSNKYFNSINTEIGKLYGEKREIQSGDYTDSEKYYLVKEIQKKINALSKEALNEYDNVTIDGSYATVGGKHYRLTDEGWEKLSEEEIEKQNDVIRGTGITPNDYWSFKNGVKDMKLDEKIDYVSKLNLTTTQKNALINGETDRKEPIDLTGYENYDSYDEFKLATESPKKYSASRVIGYDDYTRYMDEINDIEGEKDSNGKTKSGTQKRNRRNYIFSLDLDFGQKAILYRSIYGTDGDKEEFNKDIVNYLDSRDDISYEEMVEILESLEMKMYPDGTVDW